MVPHDEAPMNLAQPDAQPDSGRGPSEAPQRAWWQRVPAPAWGLLALFVGMGLGSVFPTQAAPVGNGVLTVMGWIRDAAPYIIFFTLTPAIVDMLRTGSAAKFAGAVSAAFVVTTLLAGIWGILVLTPLFQLDFAGPNQTTFFGTIAEVIGSTWTLALTSEPFIAIWFGALVALFLHFGAKTRALEWFCRPVADVYRAIGVKGVEKIGEGLKKAFPYVLFAIGVYIPTGIADAIARSSASIETGGGLAGFAGSSPVTWYFITVAVIAFLLFTFLAAGTFFVAWYTKFPAKAIFRDYLAYVYPFAWATASSTATIPINLEATEHGLKVRKEVRDFIIPLGATVNLDGTMVAAFALTVVAGMLVGYTPTVVDLAILVIPLTVVTVGVPGIPGGAAAIAPPVIASFLPITEAQFPAFQAIWFGFSIGLSDQFRTGVNSCDNGLICRMFEHWYPKHFAKQQAVPIEGALPAAPDALAAPEAPEASPALEAEAGRR